MEEHVCLVEKTGDFCLLKNVPNQSVEPILSGNIGKPFAFLPLQLCFMSQEIQYYIFTKRIKQIFLSLSISLRSVYICNPAGQGSCDAAEWVGLNLDLSANATEANRCDPGQSDRSLSECALRSRPAVTEAVTGETPVHVDTH